jgi:RNA polymerase sigma-70 factor (ECF subfamily)
MTLQVRHRADGAARINGRRRAQGNVNMSLDPSLQHDMLAAMPGLRLFACSLCRNSDQADDLVQETLTRGIACITSFKPGTSMAAWLTTILRNCFRDQRRKRRYEVTDPEGAFERRMAALPEQEERLLMIDLRDALAKLPRHQRDAVILVGAEGLSCEEAGKTCFCAAGTIKSRASRGRARLAELLSVENTDDLGPGQALKAALYGGGLRWARQAAVG